MPNADEPEPPPGRVLTLLGRLKLAYLYWTVVLIVFAAAVAVFLSAPRTADGTTDYPFLDSVVRAASLFVVSLDLSTLEKPIGFDVYAVAIAAVIVTFVGTLTIFVRGVSEWARRSLQSLDPRRRAVLLGFGRVNRAVARSLRRQGFEVTVGDLAFDDGARRLASRHRLLLVAADLTDPDALEPLQLEKSDRVVVALGNDMANVELGASLIRPGGPLVFVHSANVQLAASLRQLGRDGLQCQRDDRSNERYDPPPRTGGGWVFSLKEEGARRLMARAQLPLLARAAGLDRVHLVIFGFGDQGRAVLLEAVLDCTAIGLAPPAITVVDRDADACRRQFSALRPRLMDGLLPPGSAPDITFLAADFDRLDMATDPIMATIEARGRPTAYVVSCGEDAVNLDAGLRLEQAMRRSHRMAVPIYLAQAGAGLDSTGPLARRRSDLLRTFGSLDEATAEAPLVDDDPDRVPRQLHDAYNAQAIDSGILEARYALTWDELSETMRESNRRAVRHARTKLLDLGLRWRGSARPGLPVLPPELATRFNAAESALHYGETGIDLGFDQPTQEGRLMAMSVHAEHRRWLIDRAMDDWSQAPDGKTRVDQRRQHVNMVTFGDLTAVNKHFDAMFIRGLLQHQSLPTAKGPLASLRTRAALFVAADAATPAIAEGTTDLSVGWSNSLAALAPANAGHLVERIRVWSAGGAASRCTVYLARPAPSQKQSGLVPMADILNRIMLAVDPLVVLEVVHAYGPGISELDPGMPDEELRKMLEDHG